MDLEQLANWSEPYSIPTQRGGTLIRTAKPSAGFWKMWAKSKFKLREMGVSPRKLPDGSWEVTQFMDGVLHELALDSRQFDSSVPCIQWPYAKCVVHLRHG